MKSTPFPSGSAGMDFHESSGLADLTTARVHFLSFFPIEGQCEAVYAHSHRNLFRLSGRRDSELIHMNIKIDVSG